MAEEEQDSHFLKSVTSLGDERKIVASEDIYSQSGIKLASAGTSIDSSFYDRLVKHKLKSGLEACMSVEGALSASEIAADVKRATRSEFSAMENLVDMSLVWSSISRIHLNDALAFKLTVAKEKRRDIYEHTLRIVLISLYLGIMEKMNESKLVQIAAAALFHDIGELHIDPGIIEKPGPLTQEERRHIYAHPMTAYVILKEFPEYHPEISTAVLQHHESLDGSGYPAGITGRKISRIGKILSAAEMAGGLLSRSRPEIALKFNKDRLQIELVGHLSELLRKRRIEAHPVDSIAEMNSRLVELAGALSKWKGGQSPMLRIADQRVRELLISLYDAGFNPDSTDWLTIGIEGNEEAILDVEALLDETAWRFGSLSRELSRLWPEAEKTEEAKMIMDWIGECSKILEK
ncbi:MAG: HD domain-containing protein [Burkholderiales bacterium]|nr:HD domain-containing protein [Burkholderiales bacterium]